MKVAVTGASGFVGLHVLNALLARNVEVVAVSRDASRLDAYSKAIRIVELDISNPGENVLYHLGKPNILIHLAWDGLPNYKSLSHFETELPRQYEFLSNLIKQGLPSLLVTGTCFEYGMQSGPLAADAQTKPINSYGFAKNALRQQLDFLKPLQPFNFTWARLFYMYGEGQADGSLYSKLKQAVMRGDKVFNMSNGEQLRDYLPVEEVAYQLVRSAIEQPNSGSINICSGKPISVRKLVEGWLVENQWKIALNFGYYPYPDYEPMAFWGKTD